MAAIIAFSFILILIVASNTTVLINLHKETLALRKKVQLYEEKYAELEKLIQEKSFKFKIPEETRDLLNDIVNNGNYITVDEYNEIVKKRLSKAKK